MAAVLQSVNPYTGEVFAEYPRHGPEGVESRLAAAAKTFASWRRTSLAERAQPLRAAAAILRRDAQPIARLVTDEMGKAIRESRAEVEKCAWVCDFYAEQAADFLAPEPVQTDGSRSFVRHDPLGPVLAVMPWNFPLWQVFRFAAPALMAGNVGLLKHASNVPGCALRIEQLLREAGFPAGAFATLLVGSGAVESILRDRRIAAVTLTGSEPAGRAVASVAGDEIKPSVLELGGSDPFVVLADADLNLAVEGAVTGRMICSGQSCIAAKRFIVEDALHDDFAEGLRARLAGLVAGDPRLEETDVGPLARRDLAVELHGQVTDSVRRGAHCPLGGQLPAGESSLYPPTLLTEVDESMEVFRQETFGPVAAVVRARDAEHAVELANQTDFGLGASLWTTSERGAELAPEIDSGHVAVNGIVKSDPRLPFGGIKRSGYGRELGRPGLLAFVNTKSVWIR